MWHKGYLNRNVSCNVITQVSNLSKHKVWIHSQKSFSFLPYIMCDLSRRSRRPEGGIFLSWRNAFYTSSLLHLLGLYIYNIYVYIDGHNLVWKWQNIFFNFLLIDIKDRHSFLMMTFATLHAWFIHVAKSKRSLLPRMSSFYLNNWVIVLGQSCWLTHWIIYRKYYFS